MQRYKNLSGHSGVVAFAIGHRSIIIKFNTEEIYLYNYIHPGPREVEEMKILAGRGLGLSTYISRHVRNNYYIVIKIF